MITRLSHATIYVNNHEEALAFYTDKLGFEVRTDVTFEGFRWLTVGPKGQKDLELVLMELRPGMVFSAEVVEQLRALLASGAVSGGVFQTDDCHATYEALRERGVEFTSPPTERPYGVDALFKDNSGTVFSLTQPHR